LTQKTHRLTVETSEELNSRLENYSEDNEISKSAAVRMMLNQRLPEEV
jgi:hypothetical protein